MDHTNGPLSGMDSTSFHADSISIFAPTSVGASLPPLPSFESASSSVSAPESDSQPEMRGQAGLLGRGNAKRSASNLDGLAGKSTQVHSIEFRVARADSPVRRLRLTGNRYTFGSAEGCSIRLNDPSLRPMHAVLTRDMDRVVVRAYSAPIEVNQNQTIETTLTVGDRLRLGEYEFELLSISTAAAPASSSSLDSQRVGDSSPSTTQSHDTIDSDETVWRQRLRKEIDQWRSRQVECDRRESLCDEREAHLRGRESEIWSRAENLYRREAKIQDQESAVYQMHDDYAERQQELLKLREDTQNKQRLFQQRESEFAHQEAEYRQKLEEATAHLLQSQAQATAATEAVQEMRQQFDALNEQIEELSSQQGDLKRNEETERDENQRMRSDLASQRDAAIDAQAESEVRRREAIDRVEEMTAELESLRKQQAEGGEAERQQLIEKEATIESLRKQVEGLQESVDEASEEANQLRSDYRDALDSVRQLEHLVAQSNQRGDTDRDQWAADADSLRLEIESLSGDLERTREEIDELRQANQSLTTRLHEVEIERDQAVQEISDRPTREAFDHLRNELEAANQTLADLRQGITKSDDVEPSLADEDAQVEVGNPFSFIDASRNSDEADQEDDAAASDGDIEAIAEVGKSAEESPDEVWPTYHVSEQTTSDFEPSSEGSVVAPIVADPFVDDSTESSADLSQDDVAESTESVWDLEAVVDHSEEKIENTGVWNPDHASESFSSFSEFGSEFGQNVAGAEFVSPEENLELSTNDATDDGDEELVPNEGSLASLLIADLDSNDDPLGDAQPDSTDENSLSSDPLSSDLFPRDSSEDVSDSASLGNVAAWDREYPEESGSQPLPESVSDSVWEISENSESARLSDGDNQSEADGEFNESEFDQPQERVDMTAMMPSIDEQLHSEPIVSEPAAPVEPKPSLEPEPSLELVSGADGEEDADDDSIEAYMNRLLGRVQGTPGTDDSSPSESVSLSTSSVSLEPSPDSASTSGSLPMAPQAENDTDAPLVPRSHAPERNSDLSAMRELANQTARNAISRSTRVQTRNMQLAGVMNFGVAVVALLFGLGAGLLLSGGLLYLAWVMAVIIAVISVRDGLRNLYDARTRMQAAERGELPEAVAEPISDKSENAIHAEDRLAEQNATAQAARDQHQAE